MKKRYLLWTCLFFLFSSFCKPSELFEESIESFFFGIKHHESKFTVQNKLNLDERIISIKINGSTLNSFINNSASHDIIKFRDYSDWLRYQDNGRLDLAEFHINFNTVGDNKGLTRTKTIRLNYLNSDYSESLLSDKTF